MARPALLPVWLFTLPPLSLPIMLSGLQRHPAGIRGSRSCIVLQINSVLSLSHALAISVFLSLSVIFACAFFFSTPRCVFGTFFFFLAMAVSPMLDATRRLEWK